MRSICFSGPRQIRTAGHVAIAAAPNGARRSKADHPHLPLTPAELAQAAAAAAEAGAAMIHLHVRDGAGIHVLDAERYREATAAVSEAVGSRMIVQITTEAVGRYHPEEQIALVQEVRPEAVSLALRELCADRAAERSFSALVEFMRRERIAPQYILYDAEDVARFVDLLRRGIVSNPSVLYVLGRYGKARESRPDDLLPLLAAAGGRLPRFMTCAFGRHEAACCLASALLGGDVRVGFENNLHLPSGKLAPTNDALIRAVVEPLVAIGGRLKTADDLRTEMARDVD